MFSLLNNSHSSSQVLTQSFVLLLVSVAALTDASLYLHSKELLAVYVTGDTSKLGQFASQGNFQKALPLAGIIATFLTGTIAAAWAGNRMGRWRAPVLLSAVGLLMVVSWPASAPEYPYHLVILVALAMGTLNQVCSREPGVTFVTGTLVKLGRAVATGDFSGALPLLLRWFVWLTAAFTGAIVDNFFPDVILLIIAVWSFTLAGLHLLTQVAAARYGFRSRH